MTYREQIQRLIQLLDLCYDLAGATRDTAYGLEKEPFNQVRKYTRDASYGLQRLDNNLDPKRASMELGDGYDKYIKETLDI